MEKKILLFLFLLLLFLLAGEKVFAVTISINNPPQSISTDPFTLKVTISGANAGNNYLRIDLYKPSTSNYFAETFNGLSWYSDGDHTQYYSLNIEPGIDWSGEIQGRIGNPTANQYNGPGLYKLRVRRFTTSGNFNSTEANNNAVDVTIDALLSTPTPNPTSLDVSPTMGLSPILTETTAPLISNPQPQTYNNIYLSEVMVDPETGSSEWIEIYNNNDFQIFLNSWYIDDLENEGTTPKKFSLTVNSQDYAVFELSSSMFNNNGDSVRLLDFNQI